MRIKTSSTLICFPFGDKIAVFNYLSKSSVLCSAGDLNWLTEAPDWTDGDEIVCRHPAEDPRVIRQKLQYLCEMGIMVAENSDAAHQDAHYCASWTLDRATAFHLFLATDNPFISLEAATQAQIEQAMTDPSPDLYWPNNGCRIALPAADLSSGAPVLDVMRKRRTNRHGLARPLTLSHLADCLWAGLGITGFVRTETSLLPLKMTPSGGARNPFEAFLVARDVEELDPGVYHYAAIDHSLGLVKAEQLPSFSELLAGQEWADTMPALIVLVASLNRTAWKYRDANAYRVVLIEAGHIGQNLMLACTSNKLTACPTAALAHTRLKSLFGLESLTDVPMYAIAIGHPGADPDEVIGVADCLRGLRDKGAEPD